MVPRLRPHVGFVPLFWRLFIPNATVLAVASVALMVQPPSGHIPVVAGGLGVMLVIDLVLMRRAFAPLARLTATIGRVDPLRPGTRLAVPGSQSEVTLLAARFNAMLERLETERRESARRAGIERDAERRLLAATLQGELGERLAGMHRRVARMGATAPPDQREGLDGLRSELERTDADVRRLAHRLRPEALDALGLVPALAELVERLADNTDVRIAPSFEVGLPPLHEDEELVLFRVAQESLTNAIRHADASRVEVGLARVDGHVVLRVCDDGRGLNGAQVSDGGIRTMRERAVSVAGRLEITSPARGCGTEVRLEVPLPR
jgi:two-component system sensor histidine kinase UhpB